MDSEQHLLPEDKGEDAQGGQERGRCSFKFILCGEKSHKDTFNLVMNSRATSDKDLPDRHLLTHFNERLSLRINLNCDNLEH